MRGSVRAASRSGDNGGKYILFEAKLKARNPKESTPLNNIRWKKIY